jgi:hypothetical protein
MDTPESMKAELSRWNGGDGIDLEGWLSCEGRFALAVGYIDVFWPEFVEVDGYILRAEFGEETLRSFSSKEGATRESVEWVMNHLHIADIHHRGCKDLSKDKLIVLGRALAEIYKVKLAWQFPDRPCVVELYVPDDEDALYDYQISFWQRANEGVLA